MTPNAEMSGTETHSAEASAPLAGQSLTKLVALNSSSRSYSSPRLLDLVRVTACPKPYAMRTGHAYLDWVARPIPHDHNQRTGRGRAFLAGSRNGLEIGVAVVGPRLSRYRLRKVARLIGAG